MTNSARNWIWPHLLKKSLMENFFCVVLADIRRKHANVSALANWNHCVYSKSMILIILFCELPLVIGKMSLNSYQSNLSSSMRVGKLFISSRLAINISFYLSTYLLIDRFHVETSYLICTTNQIIGFYIKYSKGLKWVKFSHHKCNNLVSIKFHMEYDSTLNKT